MMFSNNFVLAVKDSNRKVLREIAGKTYLPFNSEYSLLLKNNNNVRACCSVSIDGTDVLGGTELIIGPNSSVDLERFLVDGNNNQGNRFRFVPLSDNLVQDPSSPENGLIEVRFWKELRPTIYNYPIWVQEKPYWPVPSNPIYCSSSAGTASKGFTVGSNFNQVLGNAIMPDSGSVNCFASQAGATVAGSISNQSFTTTSFGWKDGEATVIRLQLMGKNEPVTVEKTKHIYCGGCGKSNSYNSNFCGRCGFKLDKSI
jgi:hypothetical protein